MDVIKRENKKAIIIITSNYYVRVGFEYFLKKHKMFEDDFYLITMSYDSPDAIFDDERLGSAEDIGFIITDHLKAEVISYIYPDKSSCVITYDKHLTDYIVLLSKYKKRNACHSISCLASVKEFAYIALSRVSPSRETAHRLGCSIKTESHYRRKVLRKMDCHSEAQFLKLIKEKYSASMLKRLRA